MSTARRSADLRSAKPVDTMNRCPLIILLKYQRSPRFIKPMAHSFAHPSIKCDAIEPKDPALAGERDLAATHAGGQRVTAHAEIPRGGVHIEVARVDCRTLVDDLRCPGGLLNAPGGGGRASRWPDVRGTCG